MDYECLRATRRIRGIERWRIRAGAGAGAVSSADDIKAECDALCELLLEKNRAYGDSALEPIRLFSKADATEQLRVRIDDKLSRVARGSAAGEDVIMDLLGYFILLRIAERRGK